MLTQAPLHVLDMYMYVDVSLVYCLFPHACACTSNQFVSLSVSQSVNLNSTST